MLFCFSLEKTEKHSARGGAPRAGLEHRSSPGGRETETPLWEDTHGLMCIGAQGKAPTYRSWRVSWGGGAVAHCRVKDTNGRDTGEYSLT